MAMTATEKDEFLATMRERRTLGESAEEHNKKRAIKVLDFVYPTEDRGQWPQELFASRDARGLPSLTINRIPAFVNQVIGDHLTNRPQIKVRPAGLDSDQQGASNREGIIRQSEQASRAKFIIDQAYKTMAVSGFPVHWQINTRFVSDDSFNSEIVWEAITDQFSVICDPHAKEPDGRDANWKIVLETISNDEWKRRYPGKDKPASVEGLTGVGWFDDESVTIAIYWQRKSKKRTRCCMKDGLLAWKDELSDAAKRHIEKERETDDWHTEVAVCSATEILDEPKEKPWQWIPIVTCTPPHIIKEGKKWYRSLPEDAIDPQRFYNYWKSMNVQHIKPKPPYVTAAMIKGLEAWWDRDDKSDLKYLPVNSDGAQWPHDNPPPQVSTAIVQEEQSALDDLKGTMGMWNPSLGASEQSLSGKAIGKLQMAGDKGNMEYVNCLVRALTFTGDIILDMNPAVNDIEKDIPVLGFDGTSGTLRVNRRIDTPDGPVLENDMKSGKYRCVIDVGPSFTTQRQEALDAMVAVGQGNPQIAAVLAPFMAKFGDWPYADKIFAILKAIQPKELRALYDDQPQDGEDGQPTDPRMVQMQAVFEAQIQEMQAAIQALQEENVQLAQEEQSKLAKIDADRSLSAEKMAIEREKAMAEIDLKRQIAQQEFDLKAKNFTDSLLLQDKIKTAEMVQKDQHREQERSSMPEPTESEEMDLTAQLAPIQAEVNDLTKTVKEFIAKAGNGKESGNLTVMVGGRTVKTTKIKTPEGREYTAETVEKPGP